MRILISIFLITIITVLGYVAYLCASPLFVSIEQIESVPFSYVPFPFMALFGFFVLVISIVFILLPLQSIRGKRKGSIRWFYIPMLIGALIGISVNYANFYLVIKPNNMVECPKKAGYKKNLMHDYVTDLSLCEKF
ncbi:hypothetical protein P3584_23325 [Vibrio parahaemolyticus]|uniref:hypothetical protein n=1 Tax=Vibrio parahaemolyticus TaxID=670 RepID=UPI00215C8DFB|nr:hypothetical protein [Vibrio parahaemolyticus]EGQ8445029.1 hypothetical protein [Vibrio cholerae]MCR9778934.1 hypothetical protein [Vibrio parahaemolyticus]MDF4896702.1 hypothetical protein [Vibrio parahaemolyticus]